MSRYVDTGKASFNWKTLELGHLWQGTSALIFLDNGLFASEKIPALKFLLWPSPLVLCVYVGG